MLEIYEVRILLAITINFTLKLEIDKLFTAPLGNGQ